MKRQTRALLGRLAGAALAPAFGVIGLWRRAAGTANAHGEPRSVLLVRLDLMGDVVNGLSAAHAARRPKWAPAACSRCGWRRRRPMRPGYQPGL